MEHDGTWKRMAPLKTSIEDRFEDLLALGNILPITTAASWKEATSPVQTQLLRRIDGQGWGQKWTLMWQSVFFWSNRTVQSVEGKDSAAYIPLDASTEHASKIWQEWPFMGGAQKPRNVHFLGNEIIFEDSKLLWPFMHFDHLSKIPNSCAFPASTSKSRLQLHNASKILA